MRIVLAALPLAILLSVSPANASECLVGDSTPGGVDGTTAGVVVGGHYVLKEDKPYHDCAPVQARFVEGTMCAEVQHAATWLYEETNGISGLQRRDAFVDDTCGRVASDTLVL